MVLLGVTVNQLLLTQTHDLASDDGVNALNSTCCAEGPARAALQEKEREHELVARQGVGRQQKGHSCVGG